MKKKIGVIFGGMSTEHDVSIISGTAIIKNLNKDKYDVTAIYIDKNGKWFIYSYDISEIDNLKMGNQLESLDNKLSLVENPFKLLKDLDKVFPVLHGKYGEDGTIQGMLEMLNIPYVGCGVLSSSLCMDKAYTKIILEKANIPQVDYIYLKKRENSFVYIDNEFNEKALELNEITNIAMQKLGFPVFVKPSNSGSSIGIKKANSKEELKDAIEYASEFDNKILVENGINAREIECAVLGKNSISASCVGEIIPAENFYSFDAKYNNKESRLIMPANIEDEISEQIREMAIKAFKAVDASGLARVDFFVEKETNKIYLNEINTMPGFTPISMYPQLWEKCGKPFEKLLDELLNV